MINYLLLSLILLILGKVFLYNPEYNQKNRIVSKDLNIPSQLMIVAHPDDEILWGYSYLTSNSKSWKVICLTSAQNKTRVNEFKTVMSKLNINNYEIWTNDSSMFANEYIRCLSRSY